MEEIGLHNVEGVFLTGRWRQEILTYLKLLMEQKKLAILSDDTELIAQINEQQYEYQQPKKAQERIHLKFWHPPRRHDDELFALALACYVSKEEEPKLTVVQR
jgi:phage FluMu gp28-like protein